MTVRVKVLFYLFLWGKCERNNDDEKNGEGMIFFFFFGMLVGSFE